MEICKDRDTCKRAEWLVLKVWCVFVFLKTHKCFLFAFMKICLNKWIIFKRLYLFICVEMPNVWKKIGVLLCQVLYKIFVPKLCRPYLNALYDERTERQLWRGRRLPLWKFPEVLCRSICISFWLLLKI